MPYCCAIITGIVSPLAGTLSDRLNPRIPMILGFIILILVLYGLSSMTLWTSPEISAKERERTPEVHWRSLDGL